jgi:hypothetical protein
MCQGRIVLSVPQKGDFEPDMDCTGMPLGEGACRVSGRDCFVGSAKQCNDSGGDWKTDWKKGETCEEEKDENCAGGMDQYCKDEAEQVAYLEDYRDAAIADCDAGYPDACDEAAEIDADLEVAEKELENCQKEYEARCEA